MDFSLAIEEQGGRTVAAVAGELDVHSSPELERVLGELIDNGSTDLVVDLSGLSFMDSTGLGALIKTLKSAQQADGRLAAVVSGDKILKVFQITGLDKVITIHSSLDEALKA